MGNVSKGTRKRSNALMIMLSDAEKAKISQIAEQHGMTMSAYARMILLGLIQTKKEGNE